MLLTAILLLAAAGTSLPSSDQTATPLREGERLYEAACAACHGSDGRGERRSITGFDTPLPNFTECAFTTPEPDADWIAIVHNGGPVRAFDRRMPAFGSVLSAAEIQQTIDYIRSLCGDRSWPRGELNLPRALVTEKAFPENETVLTAAIARGRSASIETEIVYEQRLGRRSQFEVALPAAVQKGTSGAWTTGLGDTAFAFKHVLFHSLDRGAIVSAAAEVALPTGSEARGFGRGTTIFEPFVAVGKLLPADGFVQFQGGFEIPWNRDTHDAEGFWRAAIGKTFAQGGFGRSWTPMIEVTGARAITADDRASWDLVPQMQVTLSRRQHVMISVGVRIPLTDRGERDRQVLTYLLWDWFDGDFFDGWR